MNAKDWISRNTAKKATSSCSPPNRQQFQSRQIHQILKPSRISWREIEILADRPKRLELPPLSLSKEPFMPVRITPVDQTSVAPMKGPDSFRHEVTYFMTPGDGDGAPALGKDEYWVESKNVAQWLEDGCLELMSPLNAEIKAEIEISEFQEEWLEWMKANDITHIRVQSL
jgi:hypothetical protein